MIIRKIELHGFTVEVWQFAKQSFYYPSFNGNAEFPVSSEGFKRLSSYLRNILYFDKIVKDCEQLLF